MMDSLILDSFSPFTFTKITTTHRPMRDTASRRSTGTQHPRQKAAPVRAQHPPEQGETSAEITLKQEALSEYVSQESALEFRMLQSLQGSLPPIQGKYFI
jgi:katanin p60 ATPase-containing subunit A1